MYKYLLILICCSGILFACNTDNEKNELIAKIETAETQLYPNNGNFKLDATKSIELIHLYATYANKYPKDSLSPDYLFKSAEMLIAIKKYQEANSIYVKIIEQYPTYIKTPFCLFLEGFNYENNLKDYTNAKKCYDTFLSKYPTHKLATDVKMSLDNVGKSPEDIVKEFENNKLNTK